MIPILSRPEQRVKWLTSQNRALTDAEADELYRNLKRIEYRERRIARLQEESNAALREHRAENQRILEAVMAESTNPIPGKPTEPKRVKTFAQKLKAVEQGKATIYTLPVRKRDEEFTLGGVSSGWAA